MLYQECLSTLPCFNELLQHEFPVEKLLLEIRPKTLKSLKTMEVSCVRVTQWLRQKICSDTQKGCLFISFDKMMMYETYGTASAFLLFGLVKGVFPVANVRAFILGLKLMEPFN